LSAASCIAAAQPSSFKEQLIGTWTTVSQYTIVKDGQREEFYGAFDAGELFGWPIASVRCDAEIFPELG